jgi:subfamily B ATP-binding cassette protein MsbA
MSHQKVSIGKVFRTIIWPRRRIVLVGLFLIVLSRLSSLVLPGASKYLVDDVIANKDIEKLQLLLVVVMGAIVVHSVTAFLLTRIVSVEAQHLISQLRTQIQKKVLSLPVSYFDNNQSGALVSRIMSDVEGVRNLVGTGLVQMFGGSLTAIVALILLIVINPILTLYVLLPIFIFAFIALKAFRYIRPIFRKSSEIKADVTGRLTETLNGVRVVKGFNAEVQENQNFGQGVDRLFENIKKSLTSAALITSSARFLLVTASAGIMGIGGYFIMVGNMTFGEFLSFTLYLGFMIAPIVQMSNIGSQLTEAFAGLDRTEEIMNMSPENNASQRSVHIPEVKGGILFDRVSFAYDEGKEVLHEISFTAPPGSVTALVGSSGSGKSTIAGLAASFLNPTSGIITVDGQDLSKISLNSYRQHLGVVLQDDFLFEGSIRENILFPRPDASESQLFHAVRTASVDEFTDRFEDGLDTVIGERGVKLSGGQKQRVAIARALLADPRILILDEATSSLDTESEMLIQKSLSQLIRNRTTFVIAHRLSTIRQADQILVIEEGRIRERGTHQQLIEKKGRYYELFTFQSRI